MRSAEEIAKAFADQCEGASVDCRVPEIIAIIRAAQIDAANWMREEAARMAETCFPKARTYASENADVYRAQDRTQALIGKLIRTIKLPGETI